MTIWWGKTWGPSSLVRWGNCDDHIIFMINTIDFLDQIQFKFIFHQQLHQASNTNRTPPVSREIHVSLNCKYKISNYHSHQWQMLTMIMINVVITKHGYVRLFVGGAEEMWERVKSSSPKFLYQTSDSANHHSAIIKISQCNYKNQDYCQTLSLCNWESSFDEQASAESQLCQSFPLVQSCPEFVK